MAGRISSKMKGKRAGKSSNNNSDSKTIGDKSEEELDTSILSKPLQTSINNIAKLLKLYETSTEEIRGYLVKECDIIYECRVCRSIFRSLSNFILHKRLFCEEKYDNHNHQNNRWPPPKDQDEYLDIILKETDTTSNSNNNNNNSNGQLMSTKKNLHSIIDGLTQKKQFGFEIDNFSIDEFYKQNQESFNSPIVSSNKKLNLEQIQGTSAAVFQTLKTRDESRTKIDDIKIEAMEIEQLTKGQTAVLGPDGKVVNINQSKQIPIDDDNNMREDPDGLTCKKCNITFTTRKTFLSHMQYKHDTSRLVYPCLECSETFFSVWSVYRHLYNVHRKSLPEVRKMRSKIQSKAFKRKEDTAEEEKLNAEEERKLAQNIHELNQEWMDNFETDNDIQMCGGCGRRFERKAALNSHSQTCQKRIAAKNIINSNKQKRLAAAAAAEEKIVEKKTPTTTTKVLRSETEAEKKYYDSQIVTKKRKIGIQIRCDYSKPADKTTQMMRTNDSATKNNRDSVLSTATSDYKKTIDVQRATPDYLVTYVNRNVPLRQEKEVDLLEAEVVSIPSSNSSPSKDETDPLAIKDSQTSSDSEIEEILGPISNDLCDEDVLQSSESFEIKNQFQDEENKMQLTNLNDTTLKLIELINSDISIEKLQPTLDEKMTKYVNLKKLLCIPCDMKFANISKLRHHMSTHFNWWRFKCDICAFKAYDKTDVIDHVKDKHNIQNSEKIEAIIFLLADWETYELSSKVFLHQTNDAEIFIASSPPLNEDKSQTCEMPIECIPAEMDGCIIIEPDMEDKSVIKKNKKNKGPVKIIKTRNTKITEIKKEPSNDASDHSQSDNNEAAGESSTSSSTSTSTPKNLESSNPQDLRKMVYEVIFGDVTSSKSGGEEKDNLHVVSTNDVSKVISRPVRNRVKHIDKDFIYDLSEFKEQQKTVLVSNNTHRGGSLIKSVSNQISELLEDDNNKMVMVSGNGNHNNNNKNKKILSHTNNKTSKNYIQIIGEDDYNTSNIEKTLNLQKKGHHSNHSKFVSSHNQAPRRAVVNNEEFSRDKVTIVDPKTFLNDNISSDADDDIYIVENEELVAVK